MIMAILISQEAIEHDKKLKHYRDTSIEAKNLVKVLEDYLNRKTTRSQLNKALKKVKYLTKEDIL